jgi:hypothetical protein
MSQVLYYKKGDYTINPTYYYATELHPDLKHEKLVPNFLTYGMASCLKIKMHVIYAM